jgi:hypothetical protein
MGNISAGKNQFLGRKLGNPIRRTWIASTALIMTFPNLSHGLDGTKIHKPCGTHLLGQLKDMASPFCVHGMILCFLSNVLTQGMGFACKMKDRVAPGQGLRENNTFPDVAINSLVPGSCLFVPQQGNNMAVPGFESCHQNPANKSVCPGNQYPFHF